MLGCCTFSWGTFSEQTGEKSRLKIQLFIPPRFFFTIICSRLLVSMVTQILILVTLLLPWEEGLGRRKKLAEGCWGWQCCRKGNPIKLCSEISQTFPLQQVWFKKFPSPSHCSSAQLFVSKKASPSLQIGALAQPEREWGSAGPGVYARRCGDRRALLVGSAAKGQVMLHWSHFPGYRSWKMRQLELAESSHRRCNDGGVWREKVLFAVWCRRLRRTEWTVLWFLPFPHEMDELHRFSCSPASEWTFRQTYTYFLIKTTLMCLWEAANSSDTFSNGIFSYLAFSLYYSFGSVCRIISDPHIRPLASNCFHVVLLEPARSPSSMPTLTRTPQCLLSNAC